MAQMTALQRVTYTKNHCLEALYSSTSRVCCFLIEGTGIGGGYAKGFLRYREVSLEYMLFLTEFNKALELMATKKNVPLVS